jgi:hypothetical protein
VGKVQVYFTRLKKLSASELAHSAETLVKREHRNVAALIAHLAEMTRRRAHLELGYQSLFDYCVRHLRLSEGCVWSRIQVANVCRKYPQVLERLAAGKISLTVAGRISAKLTEENLEKLLGECEGRTKREVEEILVSLEPKSETPARLRKALTRPPAHQRAKDSPARERARAPATRTRAAEIEPAQVERYNFRFSAGRTFKEKLERLAVVMGTDAVERRMAEIFEKAVDIALERKDPRRKLERRRKRASARAPTRPDDVPAKKQDLTLKRSRYIPSSVRERLLEEASYQCEYHGPSGVRCSARASLEIDHVKPFGKGGTNAPANLRVLCKRHNLFVAAKEYGDEFLETKISAAPASITHSARREGPGP